MISYELAKELKDAGFPQKEPKNVGGNLASEPVYLPILSELIEACGDEFATLQNYGRVKGWAAFAFREYKTQNNNKRTKELRELGTTPEEAVARLWLALNNPTK